MPVEFDPVALLQHLREQGVEFVVIGGFAAWIHGAPVVTMDLDIVYAATQSNANALANVLKRLDAHYRLQGDRRLEPTVAGLLSTEAAGHHLLATRFGNLDLLRTVVGLGYEDLQEDAVWIDIGGSVNKFASLEKIISLKEAANRPKDLAALPTLRATLIDSKKSE